MGLEGIPFGMTTVAIGTLGIPGLVLIMFFIHIQHTNKIMDGYRKDVAAVAQFYKDNIVLVRDYARLSADLAGIIHLNTQIMTRLVEKVEHNMFCPVVREKGPQS